MNKNYTHVCYALLILFLCTGLAYKVGYSAKHTPKYIYVQYNMVRNNLVKVAKECGIDMTKEQQDMMFERLKIERGNK